MQIASLVELNPIDTGTFLIKQDGIPDIGRCRVIETENAEFELPLANAIHQLDAWAYSSVCPARVKTPSLTHRAPNLHQSRSQFWGRRFHEAGHELRIILGQFVKPYAMGERMTKHLVMQALFRAVASRRPAPGLIHHTDRGSQGGFNRSSQHL